MKKFFGAALALGCLSALFAAPAAGQVLINEVSVNPPGTDNPCEYVELIGTPGAAVENIHFVSLEGDSNKGLATAVITFGVPGPVLGSNGLLVVVSATQCGSRTYPAGTTVLSTSLFDTAGGALQNGTNSFLLISSVTPITANTDYDTNDDGTLDALPAGAVILDGVAWSDGGATDVTYGTVLSATGGTIGAATRFPGNTTGNSASAFYAGALVGATNDSTEYSAIVRTANFPPDGALTPGAPNIGTPVKDVPVDMNGDGKTDWVVVRNTSNQYTWFTAINGGSPQPTVDWGTTGDTVISGDFDGDQKDDMTVFRPSTGTFYILQSQNFTARIEQFGAAGDDPTVVADYNGDSKDDIAVYRPGAQSFWFYKTSPSAPFEAVPWGQTGDRVAPGDYDGDGKSDFVVYRSGAVYTRLATGAQSFDIFTFPGDPQLFKLVPGDYDGDGKTDFAIAGVTLNGGYQWHFRPSGSPGTDRISDVWGTAGDIAVPGDYTGDGKFDYAVWRGSNGTFYVMTVGTRNIAIQPWGAAGDIPVASYGAH